ncbi:hypothetical protein [Phaeobacter gallaeciensis]|uniref:hypothetical protein n=1 Tax=Phaeobacter gallaeciensis TaxID=60890 RepID=UPI00237F4015|nr:hypothetical protein [Phaeobacter gallaeciensis]MDE4063852.1 hypothetical protein [Phaeobacter gallaeciensis]MDE4126872.1 hypothetical protein [Phaeobacter gallaeciensis]
MLLHPLPVFGDFIEGAEKESVIEFAGVRDPKADNRSVLDVKRIRIKEHVTASGLPDRDVDRPVGRGIAGGFSDRVMVRKVVGPQMGLLAFAIGRMRGEGGQDERCREGASFERCLHVLNASAVGEILEPGLFDRLKP